ncbi:hypothetical protein [Mycobacterium sp. 2YAF39]|uniref:hypothetical protein n=1 Tax=Mycobacterium sp. 2YAF39 TaxID=3233033 RepID=UPI003F95E849
MSIIASSVAAVSASVIRKRRLDDQREIDAYWGGLSKWTYWNESEQSDEPNQTPPPPR